MKRPLSTKPGDVSVHTCPAVGDLMRNRVDQRPAHRRIDCTVLRSSQYHHIRGLCSAILLAMVLSPIVRTNTRFWLLIHAPFTSAERHLSSSLGMGRAMLMKVTQHNHQDRMPDLILKCSSHTFFLLRTFAHTGLRPRAWVSRTSESAAY